jgi:hypothetical protein
MATEISSFFVEYKKRAVSGKWSAGLSRRPSGFLLKSRRQNQVKRRQNHAGWNQQRTLKPFPISATILSSMILSVFGVRQHHPKLKSPGSYQA